MALSCCWYTSTSRRKAMGSIATISGNLEWATTEVEHSGQNSCLSLIWVPQCGHVFFMIFLLSFTLPCKLVLCELNSWSADIAQSLTWDWFRNHSNQYSLLNSFDLSVKTDRMDDTFHLVWLVRANERQNFSCLPPVFMIKVTTNNDLRAL